MYIVDGDVTRDEDLGRLEEDLEGGDLFEACQQALDAAFAILEGRVATADPEGGGLGEVTRGVWTRPVRAKTESALITGER